jgi:putative ABC transport system ATP-binding protein
MGIFQTLNAAGLTIVLVTHEPDIAEYATRIVSFRDGRVRSDRPVITRRDAVVELASFETADPGARIADRGEEVA